MADTLTAEILRQICYHREKLIIAVSMIVVFLLVTLVGFTVLEPGEPTYLINVVNLVTLFVLAIVCSAFLWLCYKSDAVYT